MRLGLIVLTLAILVGFAVYFHRSGKLGAEIKQEKLPPGLQDKINAEIRNDTKPLSIDKDEAKAYAMELRRAMKGAGTNERKVYKVIDALDSKADWLLIFSEFGIIGGENLHQWLVGDFGTWGTDRVLLNERLNRLDVKID